LKLSALTIGMIRQEDKIKVEGYK